eukprot:669065-Rhodomonas_salina.1
MPDADLAHGSYRCRIVGAIELGEREQLCALAQLSTDASTLCNCFEIAAGVVREEHVVSSLSP